MDTGNKIYVVVTVLMVIFIGLISFLVSIDRKVRKMEKEIEETKNQAS
ncbi:MAG: CcmD family protein [Bacteroidota bacterium]